MNKENYSTNVESMISSITRSSLSYRILYGILLIAFIGFVSVIVYQLKEGHHIQGLSNKGAIWGILVANIVNLIGISHVGIAISAFVRLMNLERYKQLARLAELVTICSLTAAVLNIGIDVGRMERFIPYVVWYGRWHSPFVWSMTVITTYFLLSSIYLYLAMRRDIFLCTSLVPKRKWLYKFLSLGYTDSEQERNVHNKTLRWLAIVIVPIMVSVHSVYGLIFGLQSGRAGWYNPFMAPYFVLGAVVSGFSMMILVVALVRKLFRWEEIFQPYIFRGVGTFLGFMTLLYIYFMLAEMLTGQYSPPEKEREVFNDLLWGRFAGYFWTTFVGGFILPFLLLFIQWVRKTASIGLTVICAALINVGMWVVRALIVVPSFYHPNLPYEPVPYNPTWVEWSLVLGLYVFALLFYLTLCKVLPVIELPHELKLEKIQRKYGTLSLARKSLLVVTILVGITLIVTGFVLRENIPASLIWVSGIITLVTIPLQICIRKSTEVLEG